jgi:hypothetical protein
MPVKTILLYYFLRIHYSFSNFLIVLVPIYYSPTTTPHLLLYTSWLCSGSARPLGLLLALLWTRPPSHSEHTAELFAMVWDNGTNPRRCDVCGLGGNETVEAEFSLGEMF